MLPLITRFHDTLPALKRGSYNETEVRVQFINPLFEALGWDMDNRLGRAEVKHEDKIAIAGKAKAPDYGFYLDNRRRFFVEAKKPAVDLNFAVQQTLDRLIFLRIAEDQAIEPYGRLRDLTTGPGAYILSLNGKEGLLV